MRRYATAGPTGLLSGILVMVACLAHADDDIRELRGAKALPGAAPVGLFVAGLLALALASYLLWRWRRRASRAAQLSPAETALARLDTVRPLLVASRAREFCDAASDVVRQYIETQFSLHAQQRTTEEFLQDLSRLQASPLAAHRATLAQFLQRVDVVRFSGAPTGADSLEALFQTARRFILDTAGTSRDPLPAA